MYLYIYIIYLYACTGDFLKMGDPQVIHDKTIPLFRIGFPQAFNTNPVGILGATPTLGNTNCLLVGG